MLRQVLVGLVFLFTFALINEKNWYNCYGKSKYSNSKTGSTIGSLASMLGRSANTIAVYAHFLKSNKDVAKLDDNCVI